MNIERNARLLQDRHEDREPELLRTEKGVGVGPPFAEFYVVGVTHDHEDPGHLLSSVKVRLAANGLIFTASPSHPMNLWCFSKTL